MALDGAPLVMQLGVAGQGFQPAQLLKIVYPAGAEPRGQQCGQAGIGQHASSGGE